MGYKQCMGCMGFYDTQYNVCPGCGYVDHSEERGTWLSPGTVLQKRYTVGKVLNKNAYEVNYIGYDMVLQIRIAIKEYLPSEFATRTVGNPELVVHGRDKQQQFYKGMEQFRKESERLRALKDVPGIVHTYDIFQENNTTYMITDYLEGETLAEYLDQVGRLSVDDAVGVMLPVLHTLREVHATGMLHRDISPENIFITIGGGIKLINFGAARYATSSHSKSLTEIVRDGYSPEEQYYSNGEQGPWTDVYACGATIYKAITGERPPRSTTRNEKAVQNKEKDPLVRPGKLGVKIDKNKETAILNALNIKAQDRTQTVDTFEHELTTEGKVVRLKSSIKKVFSDWPTWMKISTVAGTVVVAVLLVFAAKYVKELISPVHEGEVQVPRVTSMTVSDAGVALANKELTYQIVDKINSDDIEKDLVLSQSVEAGQWIAEKSRLDLTISAGKETVFLKGLAGLSEEEATGILSSQKLKYKIKYEKSESIAPGYVTRQDPDEGTQVEVGSEVILYISEGREGIDPRRDTKVPDVIGLTWEKASKRIGLAKLYINKSGEEYSETVPKGSIISQVQKPGTVVKEGVKIDVVVSLGEETVRVPDVQYKSIDEARRILKEAGLKCKPKYQKNKEIAKDHVISQSIAANKEVKAGTTITLTVSTGEDGTDEESGGEEDTDEEGESDPVVVPDVVGKSKSDAENTIKSCGLLPDSDVTEFSDTVPKGNVIRQSPASGTKAEKETYVSIIISSGPERIVGKFALMNLVGKSRSDAESILDSKNLVADVDAVYDNSVAKGIVISQSPSAGTQVKELEHVTIKVSKGPEPEPIITVPNVVGKEVDTAKSALKKAGLTGTCTVTNEYVSDKSKSGIVKSQTPAAGKTVAKDTKPELVVYMYDGTVQVPNVVGKSLSTAKSEISSANLYLYDCKYTTSSSGHMTVASQTLTAGTNVKSGTSITLTIYVNPNQLSWVSENDIPSGATVISERWDYTYRSYTTSSQQTLSGWTRYNSTWKWSGYGPWSTWSKTPQTKSDSRDVETRDIPGTPAVTKTQYRYSRYCGTRSDGYIWSGPRPGYWSGVYCDRYDETPWLDSPAPLVEIDSEGIRKYRYNNATYYNETTQVVTVQAATAGYREYRYRDRSKIYTYYYYKDDQRTSSSRVYESDTNRNVRRMVRYVVLN